MVGDTGSEGGLTTKCDGITDRTRNRCQELRNKTFVLLSHFASQGLCLWDLAEKVLLPSKVLHYKYPNFSHFELIVLGSISLKFFRELSIVHMSIFFFIIQNSATSQKFECRFGHSITYNANAILF